MLDKVVLDVLEKLLENALENVLKKHGLLPPVTTNTEPDDTVDDDDVLFDADEEEEDVSEDGEVWTEEELMELSLKELKEIAQQLNEALELDDRIKPKRSKKSMVQSILDAQEKLLSVDDDDDDDDDWDGWLDDEEEDDEDDWE